MQIIFLILCAAIILAYYISISKVILICINSNKHNSARLSDLTMVMISWIFLLAISIIQLLLTLVTSAEQNFFIAVYVFMLLLLLIINSNILTVCSNILQFYLRLMYIISFSILIIVMNASSCIIVAYNTNKINASLFIIIMAISIIHIYIIYIYYITL